MLQNQRVTTLTVSKKKVGNKGEVRQSHYRLGPPKKGAKKGGSMLDSYSIYCFIVAHVLQDRHYQL